VLAAVWVMVTCPTLGVKENIGEVFAAISN
jgi:hypothetical protein